LPAGAHLLITRENNQLFQRLTNQPSAPIYPESPTKFFLKQFDVQIEFVGEDADGRPSELVLYRDGRGTTAKRLNDADAKLVMDATALTAKRFKEQTPLPVSEAALRKLIENLRVGKPEYESMSFGFGMTTRQELPQLQATIVRLGPVRSVSFKAVGPAGADIYLVKFQNGVLEYRILIGPDGKIEGANGRPQ
jgi:hypothetical protein